MLRSSRRVASLIGALVLGSATPAAVSITVLTATGCKDESQPEYWVDKLSESSWRARAVNRFEQFFEDALTRSNKNLKAAEVQELINKTVEPLTKTYVEAGDTLDPKSRVALIKLLSGYRDKRANPAYKKAFDDFAKSPKTNKDDQDIKWAAIAVGDMKEESLAGPMLEAFLKLRANTMLGGVVYKDYNAAMLQMPSKSWAGPLIKKLEAEVTRPGPAQKKDKDAIEDYMDQQFWQTTAASLLGKIGDPAAVEPLIKVILDPAKVDFHQTAMVALIELGKPSTDAAIKLLKGQDEKLESYCKTRIKDTGGDPTKGKPCVQSAAVILGSIGRVDAVGPMVEVLKGENDDSTKAVLARELPKLPATPESIAAFKAVYDGLPLNAQIPPGQPALEALTEAAGQFFDPSLVDWLIRRADTIKAGADEKDEKQGLQQAITVTVIKLAKPDQLAAVKKAANSYGTQLEKDLLAQAEGLLKACGDRAACYVEALSKRENQDRKTQFTGIKAGYMAVIFGNDQTRDEIVSKLDGIDNAAVRYVSSLAIDRLSPKGSKSAVDKMGAIIEKNAKSPDRDKAMGDAPLKQVMYRLAARGG
ncbi:MAG: HEAT repeat domain-containing protein [Myxococcota bacterium]